MTAHVQGKWLWSAPDGLVLEVVPTQWPDDFEWFAEGPGQRPPQFYDMMASDGITYKSLVVFPVEPWNPADALADKLVSQGYKDLSPIDEETCEHGMSASLCHGPQHYPYD